MTFDERLKLTTEAFRNKFGHNPALIAQAPGRVDLMGSHTDYNMGYVLTMSIDRNTWILARPRSDHLVQITSLNLPGESTFLLDDIEHDTLTPWSNYVRGVAKAMQEAGHSLRGFDGLVHSTIPFSSGLSSSAAIEMATVVVFKTLSQLGIDSVTMALLGQQAENQFVGVNSGILDQYSSALGEKGCALLLDCRALTSHTMPVSQTIQPVICDTKARRELTGSEYDERRAQCEEGVRILQQFYPDVAALRDVTMAQFKAHEAELPAVVARRCRFIIEENQRVLDLAEVLPSGDYDRLRALTDASYLGARDLYEIGAPAMEAMMQAMLAGPGVIGARQAGAGFGGCMVAFVEASEVDLFAARVSTHYEQATGITPAVYAVSPAPGAGLLTSVRG
ncbi:MAG: galactokinase [Chloroflexi bacterium]|nr:galactokinase [Chloroflexota bacterium]